MRFQLPLSNVYLFEFDTNEEMAKAFCRMQEFYESPSFKGRYFTLQEFQKYHVKFFGKWDYYTRWGGFNIPGNVVRHFSAMFNDLSPEEKGILDTINGVNVYGDQFYVIAAVKDDLGTLNHELHHALFYLDDYYRNKVYDIVASQDHEKLTEWLLDNNYDRTVLVDEIAAYLMFNQNDLIKDHDFKESDFSPFVDTTYVLRLNFFKTKAKREFYMFRDESERDKAT